MTTNEGSLLNEFRTQIQAFEKAFDAQPTPPTATAAPSDPQLVEVAKRRKITEFAKTAIPQLTKQIDQAKTAYILNEVDAKKGTDLLSEINTEISKDHLDAAKGKIRDLKGIIYLAFVKFTQTAEKDAVLPKGFGTTEDQTAALIDAASVIRHREDYAKRAKHDDEAFESFPGFGKVTIDKHVERFLKEAQADEVEYEKALTMIPEQLASNKIEMAANLGKLRDVLVEKAQAAAEKEISGLIKKAEKYKDSSAAPITKEEATKLVQAFQKKVNASEVKYPEAFGMFVDLISTLSTNENEMRSNLPKLKTTLITKKKNGAVEDIISKIEADTKKQSDTAVQKFLKDATNVGYEKALTLFTDTVRALASINEGEMSANVAKLKDFLITKSGKKKEEAEKDIVGAYSKARSDTIVQTFLKEANEVEYDEALTMLTDTLHELTSSKRDINTNLATLNTFLIAKSGKKKEDAERDILAAAEGTKLLPSLYSIHKPTMHEKAKTPIDEFNTMIGDLEREIKAGEKLDAEVFKLLFGQISSNPLYKADQVQPRLFQAALGTQNSEMVATTMQYKSAETDIESNLKALTAKKDNAEKDKNYETLQSDYRKAQQVLITSLGRHKNLPEVILRPLFDILINQDNPDFRMDPNLVKKPIFEAVQGTPYEGVVDRLLWPKGEGKPLELVTEEQLKKLVGSRNFDNVMNALKDGLKKLQESKIEYETEEGGKGVKEKQLKLIPDSILAKLINAVANDEGMRKTYNDLHTRIYKAIEDDPQLKGLTVQSEKILWPQGKPKEFARMELFKKADLTVCYTLFESALKEILSMPDPQLSDFLEMIIKKGAPKEDKARTKLFEKVMRTPDKDRFLRLMWKGDPIQSAAGLYRIQTEINSDAFKMIFDHLLQQYRGTLDPKRAFYNHVEGGATAFQKIQLRGFLWPNPKDLPADLQPKKTASSAVDNKDVKS